MPEEPYTRRDDLDGAQLSDRDELVDAAVADALQALAQQVRAGVRLEDATPGIRLEGGMDLAVVYGYRTTFSEIFREVFEAARRELQEHRDHGTVADRVRNRRGLVPWPASRLPEGTTPGSHDSTIDRRPGY